MAGVSLFYGQGGVWDPFLRRVGGHDVLKDKAGTLSNTHFSILLPPFSHEKNLF